jgi:RNA polymerase sigma factor (TIGR02999 family)
MPTDSKSRSGDPIKSSSKSQPIPLPEIVPQVYGELRRLANRYMRREKPGQSLQATALVHEAYLRLLKDKRQVWKNRTHFFAIAALSMRQILVERARARLAAKRGGSRIRVTLGKAAAIDTEQPVDVLALDEALSSLAEIDPPLARIVELRFFGGLSVEEVAEETGVSPATIKRSWSIAKAWLKRELCEKRPDES